MGRGSKSKGIGRYRPLQGAPILPTRERLARMPREVAIAELAYVTVRDRFTFELSRKKQLEEEHRQATEPEHIKKIGFRMVAANGKLNELRQLNRDFGDMAYATAFLHVVEAMLPNDLIRTLNEETMSVMGRCKREFIRYNGDGDDPVTPVGVLMRQLEKILQINNLGEEIPEAVNDAPSPAE